MFLHHCTHCDRDYLVSARAIASFHNTSEGPIAYVRCPEGHLAVRRFRPAGAPGTPTPDEAADPRTDPSTRTLAGAPDGDPTDEATGVAHRHVA